MVAELGDARWHMEQLARLVEEAGLTVTMDQLWVLACERLAYERGPGDAVFARGALALPVKPSLTDRDPGDEHQERSTAKEEHRANGFSGPHHHRG